MHCHYSIAVQQGNQIVWVKKTLHLNHKLHNHLSLLGPWPRNVILVLFLCLMAFSATWYLLISPCSTCLFWFSTGQIWYVVHSMIFSTTSSELPRDPPYPPLFVLFVSFIVLTSQQFVTYQWQLQTLRGSICNGKGAHPIPDLSRVKAKWKAPSNGKAAKVYVICCVNSIFAAWLC